MMNHGSSQARHCAIARRTQDIDSFIRLVSSFAWAKQSRLFVADVVLIALHVQSFHRLIISWSLLERHCDQIWIRQAKIMVNISRAIRSGVADNVASLFIGSSFFTTLYADVRCVFACARVALCRCIRIGAHLSPMCVILYECTHPLLPCRLHQVVWVSTHERHLGAAPNDSHA